MSGILLSRHFQRALIDAGIIPKDTTRVVIDARLDCAVVLYVMQLGTEQLLKVIPSLEGIKIQIVGKEEGA